MDARVRAEDGHADELWMKEGELCEIVGPHPEGRGVATVQHITAFSRADVGGSQKTRQKTMLGEAARE
jgi:hypothetical protein